MIAWTPNPALDLSGEVDTLIPNEKNLVHGIRRDPGGNAINAGRIAHRLGARVTHLFWSGGPTGKEIQRLLKLEKERVHPIPLPVPRETRTNITVTHTQTRTQTRLSFPGPQISSRDLRALELWAIQNRIRNPQEPWLIGGSLPPGMSVAHLRRILVQLQNAPLFLDVPGPVLRELCPTGPKKKPGWRALLMKPNQKELSEWWGNPLETADEMRSAAVGLRPYTRWICISLGGKGAILGDLDSPDTWWRGSPPPIEKKGSVGAGDSLLGAMAWAWSRNPQIDGATLLKWGLAGGAATASSPGTHLGSAAQIRRLFSTSDAKRA